MENSEQVIHGNPGPKHQVGTVQNDWGHLERIDRVRKKPGTQLNGLLRILEGLDASPETIIQAFNLFL